jgi:hypothetical protein
MFMDLEDTEVTNVCAGEGQQQSNPPTKPEQTAGSHQSVTASDV